MPDLSFEVDGVAALPYAAVPTLVFTLRVANADPDERIASVALRCQIQIAATRRRYSPQAKTRLLEVFGEPRRWGATLRSLLWTHASATVSPFTGATTVELPVPCSYDFDVVATKYFDAVEGDDIPLTFLFSGTVFYEGAAGAVQIAQISWSREAEFALPAAVWHELMARYYPNTAWLRLRKDIFDQLSQYKAEHGLPTWEDALEQLLAAESVTTTEVRL